MRYVRIGSWCVDGEGLAIIAALTFVAALAIFTVAGFIAGTRVEATCLRAGYPGSALSITFEGYCRTLDKAVPVSEVR